MSFFFFFFSASLTEAASLQNEKTPSFRTLRCRPHLFLYRRPPSLRPPSPAPHTYLAGPCSSLEQSPHSRWKAELGRERPLHAALSPRGLGWPGFSKLDAHKGRSTRSLPAKFMLLGMVCVRATSPNNTPLISRPLLSPAPSALLFSFPAAVVAASDFTRLSCRRGHGTPAHLRSLSTFRLSLCLQQCRRRPPLCASARENSSRRRRRTVGATYQVSTCVVRRGPFDPSCPAPITLSH